MPRRLNRYGISQYRYGFKKSSIVIPMLDKVKEGVDEPSIDAQEVENLSVGGSITPSIRKNLNIASQTTKKLNKFIKFSI